MKTHNLKAHLIICYMQKSYLMFFLEAYVVIQLIITVIMFGFQSPYHYLLLLESLTTQTNKMLCWTLVNILLFRANFVLQKKIMSKKSRIHFAIKRLCKVNPSCNYLSRLCQYSTVATSCKSKSYFYLQTYMEVFVEI